MQEVKGYLDGERNYYNLYGDTGPLVYPAGFVYVFSCFYWITNEGSDILTGKSNALDTHPVFEWNFFQRTILHPFVLGWLFRYFQPSGQYIFACLYLITLTIVFALYRFGSRESEEKIPHSIVLFLIFSKRIHSIYILRMFNDCVAVACGYLAILFFTKRQVCFFHLRWQTQSSISFSLQSYYFLSPTFQFYIHLCDKLSTLTRRYFFIALFILSFTSIYSGASDVFYTLLEVRSRFFLLNSSVSHTICIEFIPFCCLSVCLLYQYFVQKIRNIIDFLVHTIWIPPWLHWLKE